MPTRILREGILTSDRVNRLSMEAELFYRRLMSVLDDFGRYDGRICLLRVACFPLRVDEITDSDVERWLSEVEQIGLLSTYSVENKPFLVVSDFNQRTRAKTSKYPQMPDTCQTHDGHVTVTRQQCPAYTETDTDTETETNTDTNNNPPSGGSTHAPKKKRGIPRGWGANEKHTKYCADNLIDLPAAVEEFVSWAEAGGHKYVDWDICFSRSLRNWIPDKLKSQPNRNAPAKDATGEPLRRMMPWGWADAPDAKKKKAAWTATQQGATA